MRAENLTDRGSVPEQCANQVEEITRTLVEAFGRPDLGNKSNPFSELLYIMLSSKTPPDRYQQVYRELRRAYPRVDELAEADPDVVAHVIRHGGLQNRKAKAIVRIAGRLKNRYGSVTLSPLKRMSNEEAENLLTSLPQVSLKTARCVLLYALDRSVFAVDAHCFRIAKRLCWTSGGRYPTIRQADDLQRMIPQHLRKDLHRGMVALGRKVCLPQEPVHQRCPLLGSCPTGGPYASQSSKQ